MTPAPSSRLVPVPGQTAETDPEADPLAGDDDAWAPEDEPAHIQAASRIDPAATEAARFYRGLILGLLASITAWAALGLLGYALLVLT